MLNSYKCSIAHAKFSQSYSYLFNFFFHARIFIPKFSFFFYYNVHIFEAFCLILVKKNRQNEKRRKMSGYL